MSCDPLNLLDGIFNRLHSEFQLPALPALPGIPSLNALRLLPELPDIPGIPFPKMEGAVEFGLKFRVNPFNSLYKLSDGFSFPIIDEILNFPTSLNPARLRDAIVARLGASFNIPNFPDLPSVKAAIDDKMLKIPSIFSKFQAGLPFLPNPLENLLKLAGGFSFPFIDELLNFPTSLDPARLRDAIFSKLKANFELPDLPEYDLGSVSFGIPSIQTPFANLLKLSNGLSFPVIGEIVNCFPP